MADRPARKSSSPHSDGLDKTRWPVEPSVASLHSGRSGACPPRGHSRRSGLRDQSTDCVGPTARGDCIWGCPGASCWPMQDMLMRLPESPRFPRRPVGSCQDRCNGLAGGFLPTVWLSVIRWYVSDGLKQLDRGEPVHPLQCGEFHGFPGLPRRSAVTGTRARGGDGRSCVCRAGIGGRRIG